MVEVVDYIKLLEEDLKERKYIPEYIKKILHDNSRLRSVFIAIAVKNPSVMHEIVERSLQPKRTCYNLCYQLVSLGLVIKIPVMDIYMKPDLKDIEKEVINKFNKWTSNMTEGTRRRYLAQTSYWAITEFSNQFFEWCHASEIEFRGSI